MGSTLIFANTSNLIITILSLLILSGTMLIIRQGKLPYKKGLNNIYMGLVVELASVWANYQTNVSYIQGERIDVLMFISLSLILISMLFFASGSIWLLVNKYNKSIVNGAILTVGAIGVVASVYFVFISPDSYIVSNMQQIFAVAGFISVSVALWAQMHRRHAIGFLTAALSFTTVSGILIVRMIPSAYEWDLLNNWYLSPLLYNVLAVAYIAINADFLAQRLDISKGEIVKYNRRLEEIIKSSPFPIIISRLADDKIILANDNAIRLFGINPNELEHYKFKDFFADADNRVLLNERLENEKQVQDFEILVKTYESDTPFWLLTSATTIDYNYDVVLYAAFQDITSRKNREVLLKNQATRDPLTSLYNRRYFEDEVNKRIKKAQQENGVYCVLMTDVDLFKRVNDTYGHKTGDKVLMELASTSEKALRECDIVARYGGEEFVIFLSGVDAEQAYSVAERLRETISELKVPSDDGRIVQFTISIGISSSKVSDNIDTLIKTADEALYKAKQNGRNRVEIFTPEDLKNFKPEEELPHKDESQNRHPIFEKEENVEISLLDGIAENHISEEKTTIEKQEKPKEE